MNNEQFRRLLLDGGDKATSDQNGSGRSMSTGGGTALGSRKSAFGSMTPRNLARGSGGAGADFAREVASRNAQIKKPKSSKPYGAKLGKGYQDRTLERLNAETEEEQAQKDEKIMRIKALAEQVREGKLAVEEYEKLREEIAGGDVTSTHLVKGLDKRLLERVRRGEDVMGGGGTANNTTTDVADDEFEELESKEIHSIEKQAKIKKGEAAVSGPPAVAGVKRSRDDLIRELKAKRQAEAQARLAARPDLGDKFKAIESRDKPKVTIDKKGRGVIITRDEHGKIKKKVRKIAAAAPAMASLRHEVGRPEREDETHRAEDGDGDGEDEIVSTTAVKQVDVDSEPEAMFEEAGSDYNPFAGMDDDSGSSSDEEPPSTKAWAAEIKPKENSVSSSSAEAPEKDQQDNKPAVKSRNYFSTNATDPDPTESTAASGNPLADEAFLSAISRASELARAKSQANGDDGAAEQEEDPAAREARLEAEARLRKKREMMMASAARDMDDMDLGFGGGRFDEDDDDGDGRESDGDRKGGGGGAKKRKRGPKKRKGDKNDAKDVLEVMRKRQA
ncbi:hypothetical protein ANO11243_038510 [Dothideomycetidae sp. 11243]|nr:hypothetical protein ANO11243_038510 [fungal sp. No.11243]